MANYITQVAARWFSEDDKWQSCADWWGNAILKGRVTEEDAVEYFAEEMAGWVAKTLPDLKHRSIHSYLMWAALDDIDWREVAADMLPVLEEAGG